MFKMLFKIFFLFLSVYGNGNFGISIQNNTVFVTTDMLEVWKKNMTDLIEKGCSCSNNKNHVYFYVRMTSQDVVLNTNSIVKFSNVLVNEGNYFNAGDSVFVAPVAGLYLFSWTTQTVAGNSINTELRVQNSIKETLHIEIGSGRFSSTRLVICSVRENDHVWIQTSSIYSANLFDYEYSSQSSFMGILMYKT